MTELYLAQYQARLDGTSFSWVAPGNPVGALDLRSLPQMSQLGGVPQGYGLFAYASPQTGLPLYLGNDLERQTTLVERSGLQTLLQTTALQETQLLRVLRELLLDKADPTGQSRFKPLQANAAGLKLTLGGWGLVLNEPLNALHRSVTLRVYQADYRRLKSEGVALAALRRATGAQMLALYGRIGDDLMPALVPPEHQADGWARPTTTITDSFNRADADALGTSSEGWSWTEVTNDTDIVTNQAVTITTADTNSNRAESDLSSADHFSEIVVVSLPVKRGGCAARFAAAATTFYYGMNDPEALAWRIGKFVAGVETENLANGNVGWATPSSETLRLEVNGSALTLYSGGVSKVTLTDTSITGNLRTGFAARAAGTFDTFKGEDLAGGAAFDLDRIERYFGRGFGRGFARSMG